MADEQSMLEGAKVIDGEAIAKLIHNDICKEISVVREHYGKLPLPKHVNEEKILLGIRIEKDVDGFHPLNIGNLFMKGREPKAIPCTPRGCIELLVRSGIPIAGKKAVVVGRSNIVGI